MSTFNNSEILSLQKELKECCEFDYFQTAQVLQHFLAVHGYGSSSEQAYYVASRLRLVRYRFQELANELNNLAVAS